MRITQSVQVVSENKWAGWIALLIAIAGIMTHPEILGLVPEKVAIVISSLGIMLQALTRSIVPKE